jgi:hypothetical protein
MRLVFIQLIQRIPRPGMGTPVYDDATLFEFLILEHSKPDSAGLPS